jgi:hypothetical protein
MHQSPQSNRGKEQDCALARHSQELGIPLGFEAEVTMYKEHPAHAQW